MFKMNMATCTRVRARISFCCLLDGNDLRGQGRAGGGDASMDGCVAQRQYERSNHVRTAAPGGEVARLPDRDTVSRVTSRSNTSVPSSCGATSLFAFDARCTGCERETSCNLSTRHHQAGTQARQRKKGRQGEVGIAYQQTNNPHTKQQLSRKWPRLDLRLCVFMYLRAQSLCTCVCVLFRFHPIVFLLFFFLLLSHLRFEGAICELAFRLFFLALALFSLHIDAEQPLVDCLRCVECGVGAW